MRELTIGFVENDATSGKRIQMWRFGLWMPVTAQRRCTIVGHEQKDIRLRRMSRMKDAQ